MRFKVGDKIQIRREAMEESDGSTYYNGEVGVILQADVQDQDYQVNFPSDSVLNGWYPDDMLIAYCEEAVPGDDDYVAPPGTFRGGKTPAERVAEMNEGYYLFHGTSGPYGRREF